MLVLVFFPHFGYGTMQRIIFDLFKAISSPEFYIYGVHPRWKLEKLTAAIVKILRGYSFSRNSKHIK